MGALRRALSAFGLALVLAPTSSAAQQLADAVKATYLYKLAPFVSWPAASFAAPDAPLTICVQAPAAFVALVRRAAAGQSLGAHPLAVRAISDLGRDMPCQVAYVAGAPGQSVAEALEAVKGAPILTVTDGLQGAPHGVINLVLIDGRVRFAVDVARAQAARLAISSKLLALAVDVSQ